MRTNIEVDDSLMTEAMKACPYKTKKDAVEAGLKLLARQAAYREILKWRGKLKWEGDESIDWVAANTADAEAAGGLKVEQPATTYRAAASKRGAAKATVPAANEARSKGKAGCARR